jgi:uncharacterized membrane protein SpoIIM required for sporulation
MLNKNSISATQQYQQDLLQTTFGSNNFKFKFNIFNNLTKIIVGSIIGAIVIVATVLLALNIDSNITNTFSNTAIGRYCLKSFYA